MQQDHRNSLVSVIALCYNHGAYVAKTLESIRKQSHPNIQLVIVDDFSKDNSVTEIQSWLQNAKHEAKFIRHDHNFGLCASINDALQYVSGDFLQIISCDDILFADKIEKQLRIFSAHPELAVVHSEMKFIDANDEIVDLNFYSRISKGISGFVFKELLQANLVAAPTVLINRKLHHEFYDETIPYEDYDTWLRISIRHPFFFMNEPTVYYRVLPGQMTNVVTQKLDNRYFDSVSMLKHYGIKKEYDALIRKRINQNLDKLVVNGNDEKALALFRLLGYWSFSIFSRKLIFRTFKNRKVYEKLFGTGD